MNWKTINIADLKGSQPRYAGFYLAKLMSKDGGRIIERAVYFNGKVFEVDTAEDWSPIAWKELKKWEIKK